MKKTIMGVLAAVLAAASFATTVLAEELPVQEVSEIQMEDHITVLTTQTWMGTEVETVVTQEVEPLGMAGEPVMLTTTARWYVEEPAAPAGREVDAIVNTLGGTTYASGWYNPELADGVIELVNARRTAAGLPALAFDPVLEEAAVLRALETTVSWSHTRPDGSSWMTVCPTVNGENIARGTNSYLTAADVMEGWMQSDGHRANILSADYTRIGVGCVQVDGSIYWVQLFGW